MGAHGEFSEIAADLAASIRLGYEAEADDPNLAFEAPSAKEIDWLAAWLASEGWTRAAHGRVNRSGSA